MEHKITAFEAAVDLIEVYVLRGDTIADLKSGCMGSYSSEYGAQISGYHRHGPLAHKKRFGPDYILVHSVNDEPCAQTFKLAEIYKYIRSKDAQLSLNL